MPDKHSLTALLGSRLCHDLISPIGAIGNGMELLQLTGDAQGPEMELIAQSVAIANAKLRFFRIAFGVASESQMVGGSEAEAIVAAYYKDTRVTVDWQAMGDLHRSQVKIALLVLLCLDGCLPAGGKINVAITADRWDMQAIGPKLRFEEDHWAKFNGEDVAVEYTSSCVPFALAGEACTLGGRRPHATQGNDSIAVTF
ncbi:histidine phosphotransferase [Alphaproteobacteria bacterium KMM 3653]|uniref:Histidine phosphotransferase n=1 Tax=Harenicola maris TaxID=2841044 RepID=A0AAP2G352_9RHOB|nr:histidine phosphotransferase [Harenicola maris]